MAAEVARRKLPLTLSALNKSSFFQTMQALTKSSENCVVQYSPTLPLLIPLTVQCFP
jgi:hypothetical protein